VKAAAAHTERNNDWKVSGTVTATDVAVGTTQNVEVVLN